MDTEQLVEGILRARGFHVQKIPETNHRTPDFLVKGESETYLIEVKTKDEDAVEKSRRITTHSQGGVYSRTETTGRTRPAFREIRQGSDQLTSISTNSDFRLLWIETVGLDRELRADQLRATLYGLTQLIDFGKEHWSTTCYYFHHSEFFRLREVLDGVIVTFDDRGVLFINEFSARAEALRTCELVTKVPIEFFAPSDEEAAGRGFVLKSDVDRGNEKLVLESVRQKLGRKGIFNVPMSQISASTAVPRPI